MAKETKKESHNSTHNFDTVHEVFSEILTDYKETVHFKIMSNFTDDVDVINASVGKSFKNTGEVLNYVLEEEKRLFMQVATQLYNEKTKISKELEAVAGELIQVQEDMATTEKSNIQLEKESEELRGKLEASDRALKLSMKNFDTQQAQVAALKADNNRLYEYKETLKDTNQSLQTSVQCLSSTVENFSNMELDC